MGAPIGNIIVKGGQNPKPQKRSAVESSAGITSERTTPGAEPESSAGEPVPPQSSDGAINTTRSNIKNTF